MDNDGKKGFTVTDRRVKIDADAQLQEPPSQTGSAAPTGPEAAQNAEPDPACSGPLPEMSFASFIISLNTSALIHLGLLPDLSGGQVEKQVELARQTIDLIGILKEKTKGNLAREEADLLDNVLFDLRIKFLDVCK